MLCIFSNRTEQPFSANDDFTQHIFFRIISFLTVHFASSIHEHFVFNNRNIWYTLIGKSDLSMFTYHIWCWLASAFII